MRQQILKMAKKMIGIRIEEEVVTKIEELAILEDRSVSNYIARILTTIVNNVNNVNKVNKVNNVNDSIKDLIPKKRAPRKPKAPKVEAYKLPDKSGNERKPHPNFPTLYFSDLELERLTKIFQERGLKKEFHKYAFGKVEAWFTESPSGQRAYQASACHARRVADFGLDQALEKQQLDTKMYGKNQAAGATAILRNPYGHGTYEK